MTEMTVLHKDYCGVLTEMTVLHCVISGVSVSLTVSLVKTGISDLKREPFLTTMSKLEIFIVY